MLSEATPRTRATGLRIGVAVSRYHAQITDALHEAARACFVDAGGRVEDLQPAPAPGAYELVAVCRALSTRGDLHAVVALGCIITGETTHDRYLASAVAHGLIQVTVATGVPVTFGVLTCQTLEQARERAGGSRGNKGAEAMAAAVEAAAAIRALAPGDAG